ncbi:ankyrin repeat domain-containing protein [Rossellomorea aquimaris]|uniref:ankyrin repeat domain-containing protein n=1 Tax=Rossellomorea aquimaris TaxID=189382 RepID=UPI001CD5337C|nr:ankyrin repeat domain-containing protein [Rossellomorea aquimaris]MCA1053598.1 ankyrin repeat domain-containing protein [Rossellomorea aquimaris]
MTPVTVKGFFAAIQEGNNEAVEDLLKADTNLCNAEDENGLIALGVAAHYGHQDLVELLLNFGADINSVSNSKIPYIPSNTALHAAIAGGASCDLVEYLLSKGADVHITDSQGYTPLHIAAFDADEQLVTLLLENHAGMNEGNETSSPQTAYEIAVSRGNKGFMKAYNRFQN